MQIHNEELRETNKKLSTQLVEASHQIRTLQLNNQLLAEKLAKSELFAQQLNGDNCDLRCDLRELQATHQSDLRELKATHQSEVRQLTERLALIGKLRKHQNIQS